MVVEITRGVHLSAGRSGRVSGPLRDPNPLPVAQADSEPGGRFLRVATRLALALVGARLRAAGPRHWALVAALAVTVAVPVLVSTFAAVTADAALVRALADVPPDERAVTVAGRVPAGSGPDVLARTDAGVRARLDPLVTGSPRRQLVYRPLTDGTRRIFSLAAVDGLGGAVRRTSGRQPQPCRPARCEALVVAAPGTPATTSDPDPSGLGVVVVGRGVITNPLLFSGTFTPQPGSTLLLADGITGAATLPRLALIDRTYGWVGAIDERLVRRLGAPAWTARTAAAGDQLSPLGAGLTAPDQAVDLAAARAATSTDRFGLLAGGFGVLLLGTAVVGASALRADHARFVAALRRRGLGAGPLRWVTVGECLTIAAAAGLAGLLAGAGLATAITGSAGMPMPGAVLDVLRRAAPGCLLLTLAAAALLLLVLWPAVGTPGWADAAAAWRLLGYAAGAAAIGLVLVVSRGSSSGSADSLVTVLPVLVLLVAALGAARVWPWLVGVAARAVPRRRVGLQLGVAGIARHPLLAAATVALIAAGIGSCQFAVSYRATLRQGALDEAAYQVPTDLRVSASARPGRPVVPPLAQAPAATYAAAAGPGTRAYGALRSAGSVRLGTGRSDVVQLAGVDPVALTAVRRWSHVAGGTDPDDAARRIADPGPPAGVRLPAGSTLWVGVDTLPADELTAWLRADDGRERAVRLRPSGADRLRGAMPAAPVATGGGWRLIAVTVTQSFGDATRRAHSGESPAARAVPAGRVTLTRLAVDDRPLPRPWAGWTAPPAAGLRVTRAGALAAVDYRLETGAAVLSAGAPGGVLPGSRAAPLPVAADPQTAAAGPLVTLTVDQRPVIVRVVAGLDRFPTLSGRFVVADADALAGILDRTAPGSGQPQELWLSRPAGAAPVSPSRLLSAPFAGVTAISARSTERGLLSDPVAVGAVRLLLAAAGLTLLISLVALVLLVVGERFEGSAELFSLEADGVRANTLRAALWCGAALVSGVAVPFGVVAGLALTRLTARLVPLTAGAQAPQPPLAPAGGVLAGLAVALAGLAAALAVAALVTRAFLREPMPVLPEPA